MSIKRTIITTVVALALVAVVAPGVAQGLTIDELLAQIATLQSQLLTLQGGTTTPPAGGAPSACAGVTFTRNLIVGSTGSDVKCLQAILNLSATTKVALTGAGSPGLETTYFGPKTLVAVKTYQVEHGWTPANQVGPMTRAALNASISGGTLPPVTPPVTGTVSAALAIDNPAAGAIVPNQASADLLHINFTGTGTITSLTLQRSGISTQNTLTGVYLYDGNTRLTGGYTFNTTSQIVMNNLSIPVSGSKVISVKADVYSLATNDSSSIAVTLTGFTVNAVAATANVMGNTMSVVTGNVATADFPTGNTPSPATTTINAGSMSQTLWSRNISITPRSVMLYGMTVKQIGSAPTNAIANAGLYIDGVLAGTAAINANSQFVFSVATPVTLSTGSHLVEVRGDVVGGADRNFYLALEQGSDILLKDSQLGVYVATTTNTGSTAVNLISGTINISNGTLTVNQDVAFNNTTTLVGGASNVQMAGFKFTAYGEDVKVTSLTFTPTITGGPAASNTLTNVGLYVNGAQVGSNYTVTTGTAFTFANLGSSLLVPVGTPVIIAIKGDVISTLGAAFTGGTAKFDLGAGSGNAQGMTSQKITSTGAQGGQSLSISGTNVSFAASTGFAASTPAPNTAAVKLGSFTFQTASAEGATVNSIVVSLAGTMPTASQLTNLTVKNGVNVIGTPIGNPIVGTNNFSVNIPVPISSSTVFDVYGDIGSAASALNVTPSMGVTYRGSVSNLSTTVAPTAGVQTTCGAAIINSSNITFVPGSSLAAQFVTGNTLLPLDIATFNVRTNNNVGGAVIKDMTFTVSPTVASVTVNGVKGTAVSGTTTLYNVGITVPSDNSGINIPVKVELVCIGSGCSGVSNTGVVLNLTGLTYNDGNTIQTISPAIGSSTLALVASIPVVSLTTSATTGLSVGNQQIGTFTIAAGSTGDIKIKQIPVVTGVSGTITIPGSTVELRDATGNVLPDAPSAVAVGAQNLTFTTARTIAKGTSTTFTLFATTGGSLGAAGTSNVSFSLGAKGSFLWDDVIGNVQNIAGTNIYNYPSGSQTKSN